LPLNGGYQTKGIATSQRSALLHNSHGIGFLRYIMLSLSLVCLFLTRDAMLSADLLSVRGLARLSVRPFSHTGIPSKRLNIIIKHFFTVE